MIWGAQYLFTRGIGRGGPWKSRLFWALKGNKRSEYYFLCKYAAMATLWVPIQTCLSKNKTGQHILAHQNNNQINLLDTKILDSTLHYTFSSIVTECLIDWKILFQTREEWDLNT